MANASGLPDWLANPTLISPSLDQTHQTHISQFSLSPHSLKKLSKLNISHLFPVQQACIPILLHSKNSFLSPMDLCVSASTGSGKTLAYTIPIIESLLDRVIPRIRALIVLPTRDLVMQVKRTFEDFVKGTDLRIALITGQQSFSIEQQQFSGSRVDVLIATPGRLIDHLKSSTFTLEHLRFLVIDEADKLLDQKYNDWLINVLKASHHTDNDTTTFRKNYTRTRNSLQKLLFSATLTRNPGKIASLHLQNPKYISLTNTTQQFILPSTLSEKIIVVDTNAKKPLVLLHYLCKMRIKGVVVFTKSVESAHRLSALINVFFNLERNQHNIAAAFSSTLPKKSRSGLINSFKSGEISVLICSDIMSRGMDLGECVNHVINYDIPSKTKNYIHRVGRCARAGRTGIAYSVLEDKEVKWFKNEILDKIGRIDKEDDEKKGVKKVERVKDSLFDFEGLMEDYKKALKIVGGLVKGVKEEGQEQKQEGQKEVKEDSGSENEGTDSDSESSQSEQEQALLGGKKRKWKINDDESERIKQKIENELSGLTKLHQKVETKWW